MRKAKRKTDVPKILFRFVKQAASLAQKRCAASPTSVVSDPAGNGFPGWKHLTLHFLRVHMDATYEEIVDWASEMDRVRAVLQLARWEFPAPSTLWRSFERVPTRVWRQLLARSATACDPGDHGALDATFFDRQAASDHYRDRSDRHIQTLKTTALVDTKSCAVLDIHCSAHWPHDTQVGRQVALRNTEKVESLAGDKGYDDQSLREALRSDGVRPLIKHRLFAASDHAHNARLDSELYGQRWMAESAFSAIKRRYGPAVGPCAWYRQFRELVLTATVYNLEQALKQ
jgi:IS5 family transposase